MQVKDKSLELDEVFQRVKKITGISEQYWVGISGDGKLISKRYSSEVLHEAEGVSNNEQEHIPSMEGEIELGHWYAVYWQPTDY